MPEPDANTTKRLVILAIDDAWRRLRTSFNELRSEDADESGACGEWSVNQVLWHIGAWDRLLITALKTPDDGYDYPEPDSDKFNADAVSTMADASSREVIERLETTHRRLRDALANAPTQSFPSRPPQTSPNRRVVIAALRRARRPNRRVAS